MQVDDVTEVCEPHPAAPNEAPFKGIDVEFRTVDRTRVRFADSGAASGTSVLLTSPWPESVYAFARIWPTLAPAARLVAVDLPGFGGSERREDLLSPRAMGEFLARWVDACGLEKPHIVAPDVGTSAALFAAAAHPGLVSSVIVGSGGAAVPIALGGQLEHWTLAPDLDSFRTVDPRPIVGATLETIAGYTPPPEIREDYLASYDGDRFVESMRYVRRYPDQLPELARLLPDIETPVLIIAEPRDRAVPLANDEFLAARSPHATLSIVDAGHFVWEEAPGEYAALIAQWLAGGYRDGAR